MVTFKRPWQHELTVWQAPMTYEDWEATLCQGMVGNPIALKQYYEAQWDPLDCREFLLLHKRLKYPKPVKSPRVPKPPVERVVVLDVVGVKRRIAKLLWRETGNLLLRRLTPDARELVLSVRKIAGEQLGIAD